MAARLEGHEESAATRPIAGFGQRDNLGMGPAVGGVVTLTNEMAFGIEDDRSDHRVGGCAAAAAGSQLESAFHPAKIIAVMRRGGAAARTDPSRSRRNLVTSSWNARS